jgi:lipid-A-disaccharide synthase
MALLLIFFAKEPPGSQENSMDNLFLFAGEKSGDLHGAELLSALKKIRPDVKVWGVGGPLMRSQGLNCFLPMEKFQVMGFVDVFCALPKLLFYFYKIGHALLKNPPKTVIFIDYPGFNLRMAKYLKKKKIPSKLCQFISPSVWAHGKKRIQGMANTLDLLLSILPFEKQYFSKTTLPVIYVGHPLITRIANEKVSKLKAPADKKVVAVFPGSRQHEIQRNLPIQMAVCKHLKAQDSSLFFALSVSGENTQKAILPLLEAGVFDLLVSEKETYSLMQSAYVAIAKSGTVTLELALHQVPTVVTYGVSSLDLFIVQHILKLNLPFYALVNIIGNQEIFSELFGPHFTENTLSTKISHLLYDQTAYETCQKGCLLVKNILGSENASLQAAKAILQL